MGDLRHVSTSMEQHTFLSRSHWSAHKHIAIWPYCLHCMTHDIHYVRIGDKTVSVMLFGMSHWRIGKFFLSFLVVLLVLSGRPSVVPSPGHIYHRTDRTFKQQPCALGARSALWGHAWWFWIRLFLSFLPFLPFLFISSPFLSFFALLCPFWPFFAVLGMIVLSIPLFRVYVRMYYRCVPGAISLQVIREGIPQVAHSTAPFAYWYCGARTILFYFSSTRKTFIVTFFMIRGYISRKWAKIMWKQHNRGHQITYEQTER